MSRFTFPMVPEGRYRLELEIRNGGTHLAAWREVQVGRDNIEMLPVNLLPDPRVTGDVKTDDGSPLPSVVRIGFSGRKSGTEASLMVGRKGEFNGALSILNEYRINVDLLAGWQVKAATQNGRDILNSPLEMRPDGSWGEVNIVITRTFGSIDVTMPNSTGTRFDAMVRVMRHTSNGFIRAAEFPAAAFGPEAKFKFEGLVPGRYSLLAWPWEHAWPDSDSAIMAIIEKIPYLDPEYVKRFEKYRVEVEVIARRRSAARVIPIPQELVLQDQ